MSRFNRFGPGGPPAHSPAHGLVVLARHLGAGADALGQPLERERQERQRIPPSGVLDHSLDQPRLELQSGASRRPEDHLRQPRSRQRPDDDRGVDDVGDPRVGYQPAEELRTHRGDHLLSLAPDG